MIELTVGGMTCGGCEQSVRNALGRIPGVADVKADHSTGLVVVGASGPVERAALESAIEDAGYLVVPQGKDLL
ncbi:MAG: heavy metal-associated domain-containing protein [Actinomycetota bacterium]